jgi:DNA-binding GntR family transcriptional regulator
MVDPLKHLSLREEVAARLFDAIIRGKFQPGERIAEGKVAQMLGVSQSTVREALQQLEHQGLVTKYERHGTFVTKVTVQEIDDLYKVRVLLEPAAGALAHQRLDAGSYAKLADLLEKMGSAGKRRDFAELAKVDLEFHRVIWRLSGNRWIERALQVVGPHVLAFDYVKLYVSPTYDFEKAHHQHAALLAVLKTGGPEKVREFFQDMLELFRKQDVENLRALETDKVAVMRPDDDHRRRPRALGRVEMAVPNS